MYTQTPIYAYIYAYNIYTCTEAPLLNTPPVLLLYSSQHFELVALHINFNTYIDIFTYLYTYIYIIYIREQKHLLITAPVPQSFFWTPHYVYTSLNLQI